jgi:nitrile hydratase subunit alpha
MPGMAEEFTKPPSDPALRIKAIETLLEERGILSPGVVDEMVDIVEARIGPRLGAKLVARAWVEPAFKQRLLENAADPISELIDMTGANIVVVENTDRIHNVIVCTLCSCYPFRLLGMSPAWYKSHEYRSRVVREPRKVLKEFGVTIPDSVEVRVWDSNAELRYMVLPQRPAGTEAWTEDQLAAVVTRNSMIGTGVVTIA